MRRSVRLSAIAAGAALLLAAAVSGCSSTDNSNTSPATGPVIVTSTDVWGAIAKSVAGDHATVKVLFTSATGDPHEFTPSAADSAQIADANIVLLNGAHYDQYLTDAQKGKDATVIDAAALAGITGDDHADEHGAHVHHGSEQPNEHVFYNFTAVRRVSDALADALSKRAPDHAADFRRNAEGFGKEIDGLQAKVDAIAAKHRGTKVVQTEPLGGYLLQAAGLVDAAPPAFTAAVEEGESPSAADRAALDDLLTSHTAKALLYNAQSTDDVTVAVRTTAEKAGVPVVTMTETLPQGVTSYTQWQGAQIDALAQALDK